MTFNPLPSFCKDHSQSAENEVWIDTSLTKKSESVWCLVCSLFDSSDRRRNLGILVDTGYSKCHVIDDNQRSSNHYVLQHAKLKAESTC